MTNNDIISSLATKQFVEKLVQKYTSLNKIYIKDLVQDIYIELLSKPQWLLEHLIEQDELEYYVRRMIKNQLHSRTSKFYYKYRRFLENSEEITEDQQQVDL